MMITPHKSSKKMKVLSETEANTILEGQVIHTYKTTVSAALARNTIPDLAIKEIDPIVAATIDDLVKKTNEALKLNNENLKM